MTSLRVIETIQIAAPCDADWEKMTGNTRIRHCGACEKNVYNLSAMTEDQIHRLVVATEGNFCGRLFRRADGTMLTADCPVGVKEKMKRAARRTWLVAAAFVTSLMGGAGLYTTGQATMGDIAVTPSDQADYPVMGAMVMDHAEMGDVEVGEMERPSEVQPVHGEDDAGDEDMMRMGKIAVPPPAEMGNVGVTQ